MPSGGLVFFVCKLLIEIAGSSSTLARSYRFTTYSLKQTSFVKTISLDDRIV